MTLNSNTIEYTNKEWDFIYTLDIKAQKNIIRGLCTPYDYGYKPTKTH